MATPTLAQETLTAREVVDRIRANMGVAWSDETVDTFKAGNPDAPVTGIAVTMMATLDVLHRAAAEGLNFIITHEPTFYRHDRELEFFQELDDPIVAEKLAFIQNQNLVIWRSHDHWHRREPDGILTGMVEALGWEEFRSGTEPRVFQLEEQTLHALAAHVRDRLGIRTLRAVGDPAMRVRRVALSPGFMGFRFNRELLAREDVDVLVYGEGHEWEIALYGSDASTAGLGKGLIIMGHIPSEQEGMRWHADWMREFILEVPIRYVQAVEPFWIPR